MASANSSKKFKIKPKRKIKKLSSQQYREKNIFNIKEEDFTKLTLLLFISTSICLHLLLSSDITILNSIYINPIRFLTVSATSINYGVSQQPITDVNQLMPKLCLNQSVICEGSFCIPGVRKCVCDLRMPVQFGSYCLRQVDIETKCFVTNQCNHTIKDAVCIDINSNSILNAESSKFKLDQWRQLNDLRQQSIQAVSREQVPKQDLTKSRSIFKLANKFKMDEEDLMVVSHYRNSPYEINYNTPELLLQNHTRRKTNNTNNNLNQIGADRLNLYTNQINRASATAILSSPASVRSENNQPIESASTQSQTEDGVKAIIPQTTTKPISNIRSSENNNNNNHGEETSTFRDNSYYSTAYYQSDHTSAAGSQQANDYQPSTTNSNNLYETTTTATTTTTPTPTTTTTTTLVISNPTISSEFGSRLAGSRKKMIIKTQNWPPGICSCPFGFMFDSMLRKCLALSLADSHCLVDVDCKQISMSHCSQETKKCECDEPLVWDGKELACVRPKATTTSSTSTTTTTTTTTGNSDNDNHSNSLDTTRRIFGYAVGGAGSFFEDLFQPNMLAKLYPDYILFIMIFVVIIIISLCCVFKVTANWFTSSGSSALISPKSQKNKGNNSKQNKSNTTNNTSGLPPRSPYATLKRPDHKPLSNLTQATRGRILNYDFEQEGASESFKYESSGHSPMPPIGGTLKHNNHHQHTKMMTDNKFATLKASSSHNNNKSQDSNNKHSNQSNNGKQRTKQRNNSNNTDNSNDEQLLELNDNISISQLESESKSDTSQPGHIAIPPGPPPNQQPPYMLASAMKGQGSAIAAAAAAIANKRMQKKNLEQQQQQQPLQQDQKQSQQKYQQSTDYAPFTAGHPVFL